jgi:hypothetical protein
MVGVRVGLKELKCIKAMSVQTTLRQQVLHIAVAECVLDFHVQSAREGFVLIPRRVQSVHSQSCQTKVDLSDADDATTVTQFMSHGPR